VTIGRLLAADRRLVSDDRVQLEFDQPFRVDEARMLAGRIRVWWVWLWSSLL